MFRYFFRPSHYKSAGGKVSGRIAVYSLNDARPGGKVRGCKDITEDPRGLRT
jgi:hypothetical protein